MDMKLKSGTDGLPWNSGRIEQTAIHCIGGGNSTVLEFDRDVTAAAVEYLSQNHESPQFLCVGMYAPHFPYIAPKELFDYYYDKVVLPTDSYHTEEHPIFKGKLRDTDPEVVRAAMAAYYGMTPGKRICTLLEKKELSSMYPTMEIPMANMVFTEKIRFLMLLFMFP